jgi:hypothetical protein
MNNIDYGNGVSFARFKKPTPMMPATSMRRKVSLESLGVGSSYKEQFPKYQNMRNNRYSSQTNRNYNYEMPVQQPAKIQPSNLNKTFTVDNRAAVNKSIDYTSKPLEAAPYQNVQLQNRLHEANAQVQNNMESQLPEIKPNSKQNGSRSMQKLNQTIEYEDAHNDIIPKIDHPRHAESPKITRNHDQISHRSGNKQYDSLDQHIKR